MKKMNGEMDGDQLEEFVCQLYSLNKKLLQTSKEPGIGIKNIDIITRKKFLSPEPLYPVTIPHNQLLLLIPKRNK